MNVIVARDIVKYQGGDLKVLAGTTLSVEAGEKVGLVGRNGAGKTTLLEILAGNSEPEAGSVEHPGGARVGMTAQKLYAGDRGTCSVEEEIISAFEPLIARERELEELGTRLSENPSEALMERYGRLQSDFERDGGYEYKARAASTLSSLGFAPEDWKRPVGSFSGGEQSRIALARLLLEEPDLILLDEPTNHLDLRAIEWLEGFVKSAKSAVLVVSHDRYFLDAVANSILELEDGRLHRYPGNYSRYVTEKKSRDEQLARKAKANAERRAQLERFVEKNRQERQAEPRRRDHACRSSRTRDGGRPLRPRGLGRTAPRQAGPGRGARGTGGPARSQWYGQEHDHAPGHRRALPPKRTRPARRQRIPRLPGPTTRPPRRREDRPPGDDGRHRLRRPRGPRPPRRLPVLRRRCLQKGLGALRGRAQPPAPGRACGEWSQPAAARRADKQPGHPRPRGSRGGAPGLPRHDVLYLPRPLLSA